MPASPSHDKTFAQIVLPICLCGATPKKGAATGGEAGGRGREDVPMVRGFVLRRRFLGGSPRPTLHWGEAQIWARGNLLYRFILYSSSLVYFYRPSADYMGFLRGLLPWHRRARLLYSKPRANAVF